jgi:hypothetical protein
MLLGAREREIRDAVRPLRQRDRLGDYGWRCRGMLFRGFRFGALLRGRAKKPSRPR